MGVPLDTCLSCDYCPILPLLSFPCCSWSCLPPWAPGPRSVKWPRSLELWLSVRSHVALPVILSLNPPSLDLVLSCKIRCGAPVSSKNRHLHRATYNRLEAQVPGRFSLYFDPVSLCCNLGICFNWPPGERRPYPQCENWTR